MRALYQKEALQRKLLFNEVLVHEDFNTTLNKLKKKLQRVDHCRMSLNEYTAGFLAHVPAGQPRQMHSLHAQVMTCPFAKDCTFRGLA